MNLKNILGRAWRKFEIFAYAMDYDERVGAAVRIDQLDQQQKRHSEALAAAEERITSLSGDVALLSKQGAPQPRLPG